MAHLENLRFGRKTARLSNRMNSILAAIEWSIENLQPFPALILILSGIDIMGSIQDEKGYASEKHFSDWVVNYLFKEGTFDFNEADLYGARCAIVHTLRYDPKPDKKVRRQIVYGIRWNDDAIKKIKDPALQVGVNVDDLHKAFKAAYIKYLEDLENSTDPKINKVLEMHPDYVDLIPFDD